MDLPPSPAGGPNEPGSHFEGALRKLFGSIQDEDSEEADAEDSDDDSRMMTRVRAVLVEALCADATTPSSSSSLEFVRWFVEKLESDIDEFIASAERCIREKRKQQAAIQSVRRRLRLVQFALVCSSLIIETLTQFFFPALMDECFGILRELSLHRAIPRVDSARNRVSFFAW